MKYRYLLFGYMAYYPSGGFSDFIYGFNNSDECTEKAEQFNLGYDYYQVIDLKNLQKGVID